MSATNHTSNYNLPLFIGSDVPSWLVDWNNSMNVIDTALGNINSVATEAGAKADAVESNIGAVNTALTNLTNTVANINNSIWTSSPYNYIAADVSNRVTINDLPTNGNPAYIPKITGYMYISVKGTNTTNSFQHMYVAPAYGSGNAIIFAGVSHLFFETINESAFANLMFPVEAGEMVDLQTRIFTNSNITTEIVSAYIFTRVN